MSHQLFTIGYQGNTIEHFLNLLVDNNIDCIIDVRKLPISRKPGFSKTKLAQRLSSSNIRYVHFSDLGTPKTLRDNLKETLDYKFFFRKMDAYLNKNTSAIESAYNFVIDKTCCLMCFERQADQCHRKLVAQKIKERNGNGLKIKHI
jgi:uncharacterized protein (DUF488 family)